MSDRDARHLSPAQLANFHAAKAVAVATGLIDGRYSAERASAAAAQLLLEIAFDAEPREIAKLIALARLAMAITIAAAEETDADRRGQLLELLGKLVALLLRRCVELRDGGLLT